MLAKGAYGAGASVPVVLGGRFALAALLLWLLVALRRPAFPPAGVMAAAFALGAFGYAGEAFLYFSALERLDASLVTLLLATYPVLVVGAAIALGRERPDRRRAVALLAAVGGAALVLGGAQAGALSGLGLLLAASATVRAPRGRAAARRARDQRRGRGHARARRAVRRARHGRDRHGRLAGDRRARGRLHRRADRRVPARAAAHRARHREHPLHLRGRRRRRARRAAARRVARPAPAARHRARARRRRHPPAAARG